MASREKVIEGLKVCISRKPGEYVCNKCPYETHGNDCERDLTNDALVLLEEQNDCENCAIAIEYGQPVVLCKDCIYWDKGRTEKCDNSVSVCFYNRRCDPNWFCADGKRRDGDA